jgi:hypothetical protein
MKKKSNLLSWDRYCYTRKNKGFYIESKRNNRAVYFGPFMKRSFAEFFNYLVFCSPRQYGKESKANISSIGELFKKNIKQDMLLHPKSMVFKNSSFDIWWLDTYGQRLTSDIALRIANECGGEGYSDFKKWLISGSKINQKAIHSLI